MLDKSGKRAVKLAIKGVRITSNNFVTTKNIPCINKLTMIFHLLSS